MIIFQISNFFNLQFFFNISVLTLNSKFVVAFSYNPKTCFYIHKPINTSRKVLLEYVISIVNDLLLETDQSSDKKSQKVLTKLDE